MTYQDALNKAKEKIDSLDAELILGFIQNQTREKIFTNLNSDLSLKKFQNFYELVEKRRKGFPLAYITGKKEFWKSEFEVNNSVLIPRPETELIVEEVLKEELNKKIILELGTGSGNISISIKKENPGVIIYATDISMGALMTAKKNAKFNKADRIIFMNHDWKREWLFPNLDIIISNPPYVDKKSLDKDEDGVWFEPEEALFSKKSGLKDIMIILQKSIIFLKKGGKLFLEHAPFQAKKIASISKKVGYKELEQRKDLNKDIRVSILTK